jgi:hypothetical protein
MGINMKRIEEQTYYEILEVSPNATPKEIQRAYEHAKETFHDDSLAVYSLFSEQEMSNIQAAIEEAYRVLMEEALRKGYDPSHLQTTHVQEWEKPPEMQEGPKEKKLSVPLPAELPIDTGEEVYRGKTLRRIRESMGIDLLAISTETKIDIKTLECIEEEALEKLPPLVYLKGFLKGYAQCLGMDPQKVVEGYLKFLDDYKKK